MHNAALIIVEKQIKRGWYIGGDQFKSQLTEMIAGHSDNLRGEQRRAHDELEAERLVDGAIRLLGVRENDLLKMKSTQLEKQAVAWLLKKRTTVTVVWIASRLEMGHRTNASRAISSFEKKEDGDVLDLKDKMLQIPG